MCVGKNTLLNKNILRITRTPLKGRLSTDENMNAEFLEYGYFPETEMVFVVRFLRVGRQHILY